MLPPPCMTLTTSSSISAAARSGTIGAVRGPSLHRAISQTLVASGRQPPKSLSSKSRQWRAETGDQWLLALLPLLVAGCWLVGRLVGWVVGRWQLVVGCCCCQSCWGLML